MLVPGEAVQIASAQLVEQRCVVAFKQRAQVQHGLWVHARGASQDQQLATQLRVGDILRVNVHELRQVDRILLAEIGQLTRFTAS